MGINSGNRNIRNTALTDNKLKAVTDNVNCDCVVDFRDLAFITMHWLENNISAEEQ